MILKGLLWLFRLIGLMLDFHLFIIYIAISALNELIEFVIAFELEELIRVLNIIAHAFKMGQYLLFEISFLLQLLSGLSNKN